MQIYLRISAVSSVPLFGHFFQARLPAYAPWSFSFVSPCGAAPTFFALSVKWVLFTSQQYSKYVHSEKVLNVFARM